MARHPLPEDEVQLVTTGQLTVLPSGYRLTYRETQPDSEEYQDVSLQMDGSRVTMTREGSYATSMVFEKGHRFESAYQTPLGYMDMSVYATRVYSQLTEDHGEVQLQYQLDFQGQFTAIHDLRIRYAKKAAGILSQ
jgi:uncharacterized beta-barrel protein YwiB (DUF1934 family)